ncbi:MAG: CPBP family intramembrane metalloprotease [Chloroflexota bacterium]|nr:MAG: CPBP family intramembrane metalloprotease [Chloroflexota bacterium]
MPTRHQMQSSPFFGPDGRLHPILRLLLYFIATPTAVIVLQVVAEVIVASTIGKPNQGPANLGELGYPSLLIFQLASVVAITCTTLAACRLLEGRSLVSLGLRLGGSWLVDVLFGLLLGLLLMGLVFILEWWAGWMTWRPTPAGLSLTNLIGAVILFAMVAWGEELATRGYVLQTIAGAWGALPAAIVTSLLFSILHLGNRGANVMSVLGIFMAGVFFAVAFLATRSLWLPMAVHFSWNFFEGPVFGFPVSGLQLPSLLSVTPTGPELVTGGVFGPEAGLSGLLASCVGIAVVAAYWKWLKRRPRQAGITADTTWSSVDRKHAPD